MILLIDGHNLIPKIRGMSLKAIDDEMGLIERLQVYCKVRRRSLEVYFDKASPGKNGTRSFGLVKAHFVREGTSADLAIISAVRKMGRAAVDCTVVTSDRRIQVEVVALGAKVINSEVFASQIDEAMLNADNEPTGGSSHLSEAEIEEWLRLFQKNNDK